MRTREEYNSLSDSALNFLGEKYGREFSLNSYEVGDYLSNIDYVRCTTEGMDPENECVIVTVREDEENMIFEDTYFSYLIRSELEAYIADMVQKEFHETKVYVENKDEFFSNELTDKSTLEDMYRVNDTYRASVKVYVEGDPEMSQIEYEEKISHIESQLIESGHSYTIYIFALNPVVYDAIDRYEQESFWKFYVSNRVPDGDQYYYLYHNRITGGQ